MKFVEAMHLQYADFLADYSSAVDKLSSNLPKSDFISSVFAVLGSAITFPNGGAALPEVFYSASPDKIVRAYVLIDNVMIFERDGV